MPRGNGKTSLAAVLGAYGLYADGVEGAEVVVVASDARQAGITLPQVARMVELNPLLADRTQVFANRLYVPHSDFTLVVLPAEPGALQAGILRWRSSTSCTSSTARSGTRSPLQAASGTGLLSWPSLHPGPAREGIMWDLVEHGRRGDDESYVLTEYAAPEGCELDDETA
jgi:hypothetical protein